MPSDFRHVSDMLLRSLLETRPERLRMRDVQDAVSRTLDALGRDAIRDDVPASAFEARREGARKSPRLCASIGRCRHTAFAVDTVLPVKCQDRLR
jgi:hypothetical protein